MSDLLERIRRLVAAREVRISEHGFDELAADGIALREAVQGLSSAVVVEEYPASGRGPTVLVTAYRPDPRQWDETHTKRRK